MSNNAMNKNNRGRDILQMLAALAGICLLIFTVATHYGLL